MNIEAWKRYLWLIEHEQRDLIMDYLTNGVDIGISESHTTPRYCNNLISADTRAGKEQLQQQMIKETTAGRRAGPFATIPFSNIQFSPIGTVPKKNSTKLRVIHHLSYPRDLSNSSINSQIEDIECEYLAFSTVCNQIVKLGKGCLLSKFDINDAFRYIRVRKDQHYCLGMCFKGLYYYERVLPFGLKSAPALFELFATAINRFITYAGVAYIYHYMDDFICVSTLQTALAEYDITLKMFEQLNIALSKDKLQAPTTRIEFLGLIIDTQLMQVQLPEDKLIRYRTELAQWRHKHTATRPEVQSLLGKLVHASRAIQHGRTFYQHLLQQLREYNASTSHGELSITHYSHEDINWWFHFIAAWNGISMIPPSLDQYLQPHQHQLYTDACLTGMGALYNNSQYSLHAWEAKELAAAQRHARISMPYLELLALVHSLNIWSGELSGKALIVNCDCMPVVQAVNRGRSFDPGMMNLLRTLTYITCTNNIYIHCQHIAGITNIHADLLSRSISDQEFLQQPQWNGVVLLRKFIRPLPIPDWFN